MKTLAQFINEAKINLKSAKAYGEFGEKWFDKCKDFAVAGSTRYAKYHMTDFSNFLTEMEEWFEPPTENKIFNKICAARWEMCKALKDGDIDKFIKISKENRIEKFLYATYKSENVYGSYFLDVYMLLSTYKYVVGEKTFVMEKILNTIWGIKETMSKDWQDVYMEIVTNLKNQYSN